MPVSSPPLLLPHTPPTCFLSPPHLLCELRGGDELQILQVGVEECTGNQLPPNFALDDVTHGAVIRQADELGSAQEVPATGREQGCMD